MDPVLPNLIDRLIRHWRATFIADCRAGGHAAGLARIAANMRERHDEFLEAFLLHFTPCASWPYKDYLEPALYHAVAPGPVYPHGAVCSISSSIALAVAIDETAARRRRWTPLRAAWAAAVLRGTGRR